MRKYMLLSGLLLVASLSVLAQEYKIVTVVESIVAGGLGRSRIIQENQSMDYTQFTTERIDGKKGQQGSVGRKGLKVNSLSETKLLNFYSVAGINFQNIASNDAIISSKITAMAKEGWEFVTMVSSVESDGGKQDGVGIFITRFLFKK